MEKVMIGMSGGVDSSVAAYLLQKDGFDVYGVTMKLFNNDDIDVLPDKACCSLEDAEDAKAVCGRLGIRHYMLNMTEDFRQEVIERFVSAYENGETIEKARKCIDEMIRLGG